MFKKLITLVTAVCMCLAIMAPMAFAASPNITPRRYEICGNCERGQLISRGVVDNGSWNDYSTQTCSKYQNKLDIIQRRQITTRYGCTYCDYVFNVRTYETRVVCTH